MRLYLPYGMGLIRIFKEFSILLEGVAFKETLHINTYNDRFLYRMGYRKVNGQWVYLGLRQEAILDSGKEIGATEVGPSKPATGIATEARPLELATPLPPAALANTDTTPRPLSQTPSALQPSVYLDDQIG